MENVGDTSEHPTPSSDSTEKESDEASPEEITTEISTDEEIRTFKNYEDHLSRIVILRTIIAEDSRLRILDYMIHLNKLLSFMERVYRKTKGFDSNLLGIDQARQLQTVYDDLGEMINDSSSLRTMLSKLENQRDTAMLLYFLCHRHLDNLLSTYTEDNPQEGTSNEDEQSQILKPSEVNSDRQPSELVESPDITGKDPIPEPSVVKKLDPKE